MGRDDVDYLFDEVGYAALDLNDGNKPKGWRFWNVPEDDYTRQCEGWLMFMRTHPRNRGGVVFTETPTPDWATFARTRKQIQAFYANATQSIPIGVPPMSEPTNDTLQAQNGLNAEGTYKLAKAVASLLTVAALPDAVKTEIQGDLFNGADSVFGQINGISPEAFPVPPIPNS